MFHFLPPKTINIYLKIFPYIIYIKKWKNGTKLVKASKALINTVFTPFHFLYHFLIFQNSKMEYGTKLM